jgi:transcriptional regulator with XRE-family HTH domain
MSKMKTKSESKADARRLKTCIKDWQAARKASGLPSSYGHLGAMVGGISQPAVSQYVNGDMPLNARALELFASALGVAPESISPTVAVNILPHSNSRHNLRGTPSPGMVYEWREVQQILDNAGSDKLPDIFSVELQADLFSGLVAAGDAVVLSRLDAPRPGDGAVVRHLDGRIEPCIYRPGRRGDYYAQVSDGSLLHSVADSVEYLFTVIGMPTMRWSRLVR